VNAVSKSKALTSIETFNGKAIVRDGMNALREQAGDPSKDKTLSMRLRISCL
jgi:hypothetical protein